jgi:hypothetical protein
LNLDSDISIDSVIFLGLKQGCSEKIYACTVLLEKKKKLLYYVSIE